MGTKILPLKDITIAEIFDNNAIFEVPIYQRNYAWEKDEISALIQDIFDALSTKQKYYIGTLVTFNKGDQVYEVIDGQQRLTTITLMLGALDIPIKNKLKYRARKKSSDTIQSIPDFNIEEKDSGIINGYKYTVAALNEIVPSDKKQIFSNYFRSNVHIIHYEVPKDIDLNHYFEVMNSRGEQLEKHEIIKARLIEKLNEQDKAKFNRLWESCSEMNVYIQQKYLDKDIFGANYMSFEITSFDQLPQVADNNDRKKLNDLIECQEIGDTPNKEVKIDTFQPIIDFTNFLLIVLKLCRMDEDNFNPTEFNLDDKDLISEFDNIDNFDENFVKKFGFNLLKAKFLLDNYLVHHSNEDDKPYDNPWKLQYWQKESDKTGYLKNLSADDAVQIQLVQILSMFEVSFTARQRKNYLFYCIIYLFKSDFKDLNEYCRFLNRLADKYFFDVYLKAANLNEINTPSPGKFDDEILLYNKLYIKVQNHNPDFNDIYGDGTIASKGIPLFIFNYIDYKLWLKYYNELRSEDSKKGSVERIDFFASLGCTDFGLEEVFKYFYFSRTRRSLEHFYPRALALGKDGKPDYNQINCLGNFAMIGSQMNSSGSCWTPKTKLTHYLDSSGKVRQVSVASIKFRIMMQKCKDNESVERGDGLEWNYYDMREHQKKILDILLDTQNLDADKDNEHQPILLGQE